MSQQIDDNLVTGRNLTSVGSMPAKSKQMYEETIKKNFEIIQTFLKKFTVVFNRNEFLETQISNLLNRVSKIETDIENVHTEHRKGNLSLISKIDSYRNKISGLQGKVNIIMENMKMFTKVQNQSFLENVLEKTKPHFQIMETYIQENENLVPKFQQKNNLLIKKGKEKYKRNRSCNEQQVFQIKQNGSEEQKEQKLEQQSKIVHQKDNKEPHYSINPKNNKKKRISIIGAKRRRSMLTYEKTFKKDQKRHKNDQKIKIKEEDEYGSQITIEVKSNKDLTKRQKIERNYEENYNPFHESGLQRKLINNLVSSQFSLNIQDSSKFKSRSLFDKNKETTRNDRYFEQKIEKINNRMSEYLLKSEFYRYLNEVQNKFQKVQDMHYEKCADKNQTKKAITYLQKKINKFVDQNTLGIIDQSYQEQKANVSKCLACNRIFPKQMEKVEKVQKVEEKEKKIVYYGSRTLETLPSQPLSLNRWKRKTAQVLKSNIVTLKRRRESKVF